MSVLVQYVTNRYKHSTKLSSAVRLLRNALLALRQMEEDPSTWHRGGFLHFVDNYLAALLYRRPNIHFPHNLAALEEHRTLSMRGDELADSPAVAAADDGSIQPKRHRLSRVASM